jgi:hypothetical protein
MAATAPAKKTATTKTPAKKVASASQRRVVRAPKKKSVSHEIHAYIPDPSVSRKYVGRKVWGVWDKQIADIAIAEKKNILLEGDTGSGKTLFGEAYAAATGRLYYSLPCDISIDPSSLFGRRQPGDVPGTFPWTDGPITQVVRHGGVLNISEINFMTPKIAASLYPLLDNRRYIPLLGHEGEVVHAHDDLLIIADMNPNYRGTMELNAAFKNRFEFKIPWGYDPAVEEQLVKFPTLRVIAESLREAATTDIRTPVSTNMLMEFESFALNNKLGLEFATHNFIAAFNVSERDAVSRVFDLNEVKLKKDLLHIASASKKKPVKDEDLEDIEFDQEFD